MQVEIKDVLETIVNMNINRCSYTTWDKNIQECARHEIVKGLAQYYGIDFTIPFEGERLFPVAGGPK